MLDATKKKKNDEEEEEEEEIKLYKPAVHLKCWTSEDVPEMKMKHSQNKK